jgi:ATP-dependent Clp protease protease subunit
MLKISAGKMFWTIVGASITLLLVGVLSLLGAIVGKLDELPTIQSVATIAVDELIEAGWLTASMGIEDPLLQTRAILVTNAINEHTSQLVVAKLLLLNSQDSTKPIDLYLSSPGGWAGSAYTIIDAIHSIDALVNARAVGICYSACALILTASTGQRTATPNTILMVHTNSVDSDEPFSYEALDKARDEKLWREHSSLPENWYPMTQAKEYYLTPEQALSFEIIDEVISPK